MAILRNPNKGKFTVVANFALKDDRLSLKARGLLVTMLSLPANWEFSENGLCKIFPKDGQASIRSGLKELEKYGYLTRSRQRDSSGRLSKVNWEIVDCPRMENPHLDNPNLDNPNLEKPNLENRPQLNTKELNTKELNTEELNTKDKERVGSTRFSPPSVDDVRQYCKEIDSTIDPESFVDYYTANGWVQGKGKPIKNWKAAVRTWQRREKGKNGQSDEHPGETERERRIRLAKEADARYNIVSVI